MRYSWLLLLLLFGCNHQDDLQSKRASYEAKIAPILYKACVDCHGEYKDKGNLKLDSFENILEANSRLPLISWGDASKSSLYERLLTDDESSIMPPITMDSVPLTDEEIEVIRQWIELP